uniref:Conserved oligomeric Golgi complex subunit 5 n=1 Tax=Nicotiana sylvestris TaxID=4096 RepID=A0A1U7X2P3_NICSY|nr:PREDICTED: conserved oligomeric Golgi complex subunit 5 isoform X2 [Nicotiana sylvestris]
MASPAIQRSPHHPPSTPQSASPLQRLSTFRSATTTNPTPTPHTPLTPSPSPLDSFTSDPIFSSFLSSDFDSTTFSSAALSSGSAASRIEKLQEGLNLLNNQLRHEVLTRHHDLLNQLTSLRAAESALSSLRSSVSSLQSSLRRVRSELSDPHQLISKHTLQLNNLHSTTELLQSTIRTLRLSKKLRDLMDPTHDPEKLDLSKAAQLHFEILSLYNEYHLSGIDVVDLELKWVVEIGLKLRAEGMKVLENGLEGLNQAEVGAGLQVFYNMGELRGTVDGLVSKYKAMGVKSITTALDMKAVSVGGGFGGPGGVQRSGTPQFGGSAKAKDALWQRMNGCMDQLHSVVVAVWHLQRVLSKKRDPFTHVLLLDEVMQISTGPEARQITGAATPAQLKNFALYQHLQEIHTRISSMVAGLPTIATDILSPALGSIYGVAGDSVTSLFQAMLDRLESCILQIHGQNFGSLGMDAAMDNNASPYMEELQQSILHFRSEFLSRLLPSSSSSITTGSETICTRLVRSMASRVLIFFIRHASLVRPLSESGKLRLARDMAELELAVGQNLFPVEQLGAPYRALRAFRPVIFLETSQLASSPLRQDLPPSVILHHLYSRGPEELQSPLQRNRLTPTQYSLWMDSQGEDQIWKGIKATLDDYAAKVRSRGDKEFSPVYPLMLEIGSSLSGNR